MKDNQPLEIIGKEGFLDVSKEPNFGTKSQYIPGLDNLADKSVYTVLIAERQAQKEEKTTE